MKTKRVLIIGCGDIGIQLSQQLIPQNYEVYGLRRNIAALPETIKPLQGDVSSLETLTALQTLSADYVVITLTPGEFSDSRYEKIYVNGVKNSLQIINSWKAPPKRIFFVSSTSVYGQNNGEWVDESSETRPGRFSGKRLLEAESVIQQSHFPYTIVRFAGIYGAGRNRLFNRIAQGDLQGLNLYGFSNRIHRDDCAALLAFLIDREQQGKPLDTLYIGVDNMPVLMADVASYLAENLNVSLDKKIFEGKTDLQGKRCSNQRLIDCGFRFQYPDFKVGYQKMLVENDGLSDD